MKRCGTRRLSDLLVVLGLVALCSGGANAQTEDRVTGEILIELEPGASVQSVLAQYDLSLLDAIPEWRFYDVRVAPNADVDAVVDALKDDPAVARAEPHRRLETPEGTQLSVPDLDYTFEINQYDPQPGSEAVHAQAARARATGRGVLVAVLDTGVHFTHQVMGNRVMSPGVDFAGGNGTAAAQANGLDDDGDGLIDEARHHGTFVVGLIRLIAPEARILPIRVLEADGRGRAFSVAKGIRQAIYAGADVINLSLGMQQDSRPVERAIELAQDSGAVVVAASGNRGAPVVDFPAVLPATIAVAAADSTGARAPFSNFGPEVDLSAPGMDLVSAESGSGFALWSGTSFAAPLVSGAVALLLERYPGLTPQEVRSVLTQSTAPDANPPTLDGLMGSGLLDLDALTQQLTTDRTSLTSATTPAGLVLEWTPVLDAATYDVIRGETGQLAFSGPHGDFADLGDVVCLASGQDAADTRALPDPTVPSGGVVFFYLFRDDAPDAGGRSFGSASGAEPRVVTSGDCPAVP